MHRSAFDNRRMRPPGFTLIELLVVVSIITLLMSILIPSMRKARDHAKEVACGSLLRGLGTGLANYLYENSDWLPGLNTSGVGLQLVLGHCGAGRACHQAEGYQNRCHHDDCLEHADLPSVWFPKKAYQHGRRCIVKHFHGLREECPTAVFDRSAKILYHYRVVCSRLGRGGNER